MSLKLVAGQRVRITNRQWDGKTQNRLATVTKAFPTGAEVRLDDGREMWMDARYLMIEGGLTEALFAPEETTC